MPNILTKEKIIFKNGKPEAVVLDIKKYERLLEIAEGKEDLAELKRIKKSGASFRQLKSIISTKFFNLKGAMHGYHEQ